LQAILFNLHQQTQVELNHQRYHHQPNPANHGVCKHVPIETNSRPHDRHCSLLTFPVSRVLAFCDHAGDIDYAHAILSQIENPILIWYAMMRGYYKPKVPTMGFFIIICRQLVRERVKMDRRSFVFALKACEEFCAVVGGELVHCRIWKMAFDSDLVVRNRLGKDERVLTHWGKQIWIGSSLLLMDRNSLIYLLICIS